MPRPPLRTSGSATAWATARRQRTPPRPRSSTTRRHRPRCRSQSWPRRYLGGLPSAAPCGTKGSGRTSRARAPPSPPGLGRPPRLRQPSPSPSTPWRSSVAASGPSPPSGRRPGRSPLRTWLANSTQRSAAAATAPPPPSTCRCPRQRLRRWGWSRSDPSSVATGPSSGHFTPLSEELQLVTPPGADGLHGAAAGGWRVARFENEARGDPTRSPLFDCVAWLVPPPEGPAAAAQPFAALQDSLPHAGALEYASSLAVYDDDTVPPQRWPWRVSAPLGVPGERVAAGCLAARNQKTYDPGLHRRLLRALRGVGAAPRAVAEARLSAGERQPPPTTLLYAAELQQLQHRADGREFIVALSGRPKMLLAEGGGRAQPVQRMDSDHEHQPYWHLNYAMRSEQQGRRVVTLTVSGGPSAGRYSAAPPPGWSGGEPFPLAPQLGSAAGGGGALWVPGAQQQRGRWAVGGVPLGQGTEWQLELGALLLPQVTPMLQLLDRALAELGHSGGGGGRRLYRGVAGLRLDPRVYAVGRVVLWAQFSSSSLDMSVGMDFTAGEGSAAVFSIDGSSAAGVARASRYGREREWLFPAGMLFYVHSCLTDEFAELLGREGLQLFELREVTRREAAALRVRRLIAAVRGEGSAARMAALYAVAQDLEDPALPMEAVARSLFSHSSGFVAAPEAAALLDGLMALPGAGGAAARPHLATAGLRAAAEAGCAATVRALLALGADAQTPDPDGLTPLHLAARGGNPECIRLLHAAGADPTARDPRGRLPCELAHALRLEEAVRALAEAAPLPGRLADTYERWPPRRIAAHLVTAVLLAAVCAAVTVGVPLLVVERGRSAPPKDDFVYTGPGKCAAAWGSSFWLLGVAANTTLHECVGAAARHPLQAKALGVDWTAAFQNDQANCFLAMEEGRENASWWAHCSPPAAAPLAGFSRVELPVLGLWSAGKCLRRATPPESAPGRLRDRLPYLYTPIATDPSPGCGAAAEAAGFAPCRPGENCARDRVAPRNTSRACADGSLCDWQHLDCCADRGGIAHCPAEDPVMCNDCSTAEQCCRDKCWLQEGEQSCGGPFYSCRDRTGQLCLLLTPWRCDEELAPGIHVHAACPNSCGSCRGSVKAEREIAGATSLLSDGVADAGGKGCVSLQGGVRVQLQRPHRLSALRAHFPAAAASASAVSVRALGAADGGPEVRRAAPAPGASFAAVDLTEADWGCVSQLAVTSEGRVCELELTGDPCPAAFAISFVCVGPVYVDMWDSAACAYAGGALNLSAEWVQGSVIQTSSSGDFCQVTLPAAGANGMQKARICTVLPHPGDVRTRYLGPGACVDAGGAMPVFYDLGDIPPAACLATLQKWAAPHLAVGATVLESACLLHVASRNVSIPGLTGRRPQRVSLQRECHYDFVYADPDRIGAADPYGWPGGPAGGGLWANGSASGAQSAFSHPALEPLGLMPYCFWLREHAAGCSSTTLEDACRDLCDRSPRCLFALVGNFNGRDICCPDVELGKLTNVLPIVHGFVINSCITAQFPLGSEGPGPVTGTRPATKDPPEAYCYTVDITPTSPEDAAVAADDYRIGYDGRCPKGTTSGIGAAPCAASGAALRLPVLVPDDAGVVADAPAGCSFAVSSGLLRWHEHTQDAAGPASMPDDHKPPPDRASRRANQMTLAICGVHRPSRDVYRMLGVALDSYGNEWYDVAVSVPLLVLTVIACAVWAGLAAGAALERHKAKRILLWYPVAVSALFSAAVLFSMDAMRRLYNHHEELCEQELRSSCALSGAWVFLGVSVLALFAAVGALFFCRCRRKDAALSPPRSRRASDGSVLAGSTLRAGMTSMTRWESGWSRWDSGTDDLQGRTVTACGGPSNPLARVANMETPLLGAGDSCSTQSPLSPQQTQLQRQALERTHRVHTTPDELAH
eukprot:TRINITY_DN10693_c0_g2_i2.p1 TRINITY_DN10693_c0_g2~~TRINITY_DN10693_c0_g2_i2.p1  ORF type:complete len:1908 (+),score=480.58 TRINITY_DN10693_c0_g2_i2:519-6242(+)